MDNSITDSKPERVLIILGVILLLSAYAMLFVSNYTINGNPFMLLTAGIIIVIIGFAIWVLGTVLTKDSPNKNPEDNKSEQ